MLVESLVRGCTSWSKTIATPLIPAVKVRAKALSMGSLPSSAPMFHWLFAWSKFSTRRRKRIFHRSLNTLFTGTLPVHLQSSKRSSAWMSIYILHRHVCSTAMLHACETNMKQWWWARVLLQVANEQIQYAASIQEVGPSLDRAWHWIDCTKCGKLVPQEWDLTQNTRRRFGAGPDRDRTNVGGKGNTSVLKFCQKQWASDTK